MRYAWVSQCRTCICRISGNISFGALAPLFALASLGLSCRVENVKTPSAADIRRNSLAFSLAEPPTSAALVSHLKFAQQSDLIVPPAVTSLAGFGGALRRVIPPNFSGLNGFFTYCLPYTQVDEQASPRVKILLWEGLTATGETSHFGIVSLDLVAVTADVTQKIVNTLRQRMPPGMTLDQGHIQVIASHTHSGTAGLSENPFWGAFACDRYSQPLWDFFATRVADTFEKALKNLKPVEKRTIKKGRLPGFNRTRFPGMEVDDRFLALSMTSDDSQSPLGCALIYAVHPTWYGQKDRTLSADVTGFVEHALERKEGAPACVFLNGAVGNAEIQAAAGTLEQYAEAFANAVHEQGATQNESAPLKLAFGARIVSLPKPAPNLKACNLEGLDTVVSAEMLDQLPRTTKIAYLILGKTLLIFFPGEAVFDVQKEFEQKLKAKFPDFEDVRLLSLSNDYLGYMVGVGNYDTPTLESCSTLYGPTVSGRLIDALQSLLEQEKDSIQGL